MINALNMKKILVSILIVLGCVSVAEARTPKSLGDSIMYTIGRSEGANLKAFAGQVAGADSLAMMQSYTKALNDVMNLPLDDKYYIEAFTRMLSLVSLAKDLEYKGIPADPTIAKDGYMEAYAAPALSMDSLKNGETAVRDLMNRAAEKAKEIKAARAKEQLDENVRAANSYIEELKKADMKIVTTPSGLSYKVVKKGKGSVRPTEADRVKVNYTGRLIDGTVFDSSVERGEPAEFDVKRVVKGFGEGLQLMNKGSKYTFYIPFNLGYGSQGAAAGKIPPGAMLVFDVELLDINPEK